MMEAKKKPAGGGGPATTGNLGGAVVCPDSTTEPLQSLIDHAAQMMSRYPGDFGRHSRIMQSLIHLKRGWPWPPAGGVS